MTTSYVLILLIGRNQSTVCLEFLFINRPPLPGVGRFRVYMFVQSYGYGAAFRISPDAPPELDALGFPPVVRPLCNLQAGLVLIGGPTGSGKTTTTAAIVHEIYKTSRRHVITIQQSASVNTRPIHGCRSRDT